MLSSLAEQASLILIAIAPVSLKEILDLLCGLDCVLQAYVIVEGVYDRSEIFAHVSFIIPGLLVYLSRPVVEVCGYYTVYIAFLLVVVKFVKA